MNAYMEFQGTTVKLPDPVKLKPMVIAYLSEGGEHEEAELMARCSLEIGAVKFMIENQYALDITLRCCRELVIRLRAPEDGAEESLLRSRIRQAVCDTLPGGYCVATFEARAGLNGGMPAVAGAAANGTGKNIPAAAITVGRWSYLPDFTRMWLNGEEYDLRERLKARLCLQFLVEQGAFAEASARHFEKQIDPYVRKHSKLEPLPDYAETKLHHYFNPSNGKLAKLGRELIVSAGHGTGRYYLNVL